MKVHKNEEEMQKSSGLIVIVKTVFGKQLNCAVDGNRKNKCFHRFQKQKGSFTGGAKGEDEECYSDAEEEAKERGGGGGVRGRG